MKSFRREGLGDLLPIDVRLQPRKVLKHLYNAAERWGALIAVPVESLVAEARAAGVVATPGRDADLEPKTPGTIMLQRHHDMHYGPAYLRALAAETTQWAPQKMLGPARALACSTEGVLIAFDRALRSKVVTAFRPDLPFANVQTTERDFALEARRRWRYQVDRSASRLETADLEDALEGNRGDLASAWRLAVAVGRAGLATPTERGDVLDNATALLAAIEPMLRGELLASMDECAPLDAFADAIQESDGPEALDRLIALEDMIAAAVALGELGLAERIVLETAIRATCIGPELIGLATFSESRARSTTAVLSRYWREVGAEIVANAIRLAPPARTLSSLRSLLPVWLREGREAVGAVFTELIAGMSVAQPALSSHARSREVVAEGRVVLNWAVRAFVIDREHPMGLEVSDLIKRDAERWTFSDWQVEPDDDAILVIVGQARPESAASTLADLFAEGESLVFDARSLMDAR